jgi:hypothetical protein
LGQPNPFCGRNALFNQNHRQSKTAVVKSTIVKPTVTRQLSRLRS